MKRFILAVSAAALAFGVSVLAHHSSAMFDHDNPVSIHGRVTRWQWQAPHSYLYVETKEPNGAVVEWKFEALNPPMLTRHGWTKESFTIGDEVTVEAFPHRDRSIKFAWPTKITKQDGKVLLNLT
jgi:hypothetical protein